MNVERVKAEGMKEQNNTYNQQLQRPMMPPPPPPIPQNRRQRWGRKLMSGAAARITSLPNWFAAYAVSTYAIALIGVNLIHSEYPTEWYFAAFGIVWVAGFFFLSVDFSRKWNTKRICRAKLFETKLFVTGLIIRLIYAIFIHNFYLGMTGFPYEFAFADSEGYVETARWISDSWTGGHLMDALSSMVENSLSDMGYPLCILLPIRWFDLEFALLVVRLINSFVGAYTSVLIYRIASRSMDETTGRIAGIFCMLHPVLICYVGITLKEVIMTFLAVLFIEMGDRMLRSRNYSFLSITPLVLVGISLFVFRTVLGMIAFMALFFALVMMDSRIVSWGKKVAFGILIAGILTMAASDNIMHEINKISFDAAQNQQEVSMSQRYGSEKKGGISGNAFAKYASTAVFAPLIFTIPFPTMVNIGFQEDMRLIHGGNWMRNVVSGLVIFAMFVLLLTGDWRRYTLPLSLLLGYLLMLAFTQFAHSLRFHIPVIPFEMIFAAYAVTKMRKKHRMWYLYWCILCVVMCFAWNWFKLAGRGL